MAITCILVVGWRKFAKKVPLPLSEQRKTFSGIFIAFLEDAQNSLHFAKKDRLYSSNISEVSDFGKCCYLYARNLLFQNTLLESTWSRVLNNADTTMGELWLELSLDPTDIELEEISVREIWNLKTVRKNVEFGSHVFSSLDEKNLRNVFHCHYLKNGKHFLEFLLYFGKLHKILCILKKNISFITQIFRRLLTPRNMVTWMPESSSFRTPYESQRVHGY